jgi:hypothetical protein
MAAIEIAGLESLKKRLAALGAMPGLAPALREEADAVAESARARLASRGSGELARSIEIADLSEGDSPTFAIRTQDPVGRYLEFGTVRMRAFPWLGPALFGRSRAVNHKVRKVIGEALEAMRKA